MEAHLRVEIVPRPGDEPGHLARINGAEFKVKAYAIEQDESGAPSLSLLIAPDSLGIGEPPAAIVPKPAPSAVSSWGGGTYPDPRESIPGWQPEKLSEQVAGHAERMAFAQEAVRSRMKQIGLDGRCDLRTTSEVFRRLILGGEGGNVAVTA